MQRLTEEALRLWKTWDKETSPRDIAPPHTPNSEYNFELGSPTFPKDFPEIDKLELPYIKEKGVKFCIEMFGDFFDCKDYKFNLLQFWFLDVLTDCVWTSQDDFHLPITEQKIVLSWILYLIDLIRDPKKNLTRGKFFRIFKETMLIAAEVVNEGCDTVPTPKQLFSLLDEEEEEELRSWKSSNDSEGSSLEIDNKDFDNTSCIELNTNDKIRRYVLPKEVCSCSKYDLSSIDSVQDINSMPQSSKGNLSVEEDDTEEIFKNDQFYQPDPNVPARFLRLPEEIEEEEGEEEEVEEEEEKPFCKLEKRSTRNFNENGEVAEDTEEQYHIYQVADDFAIKRTSEISKTTRSSGNSVESHSAVQVDTERPASGDEDKKSLIMSMRNKELLEKYNKKQILEGLAVQKLWEQRLEDMSDPRKGWIPTLDEITESPHNQNEIDGEPTKEDETSSENDDDEFPDKEWVEGMIKSNQHQIKEDEDKLIINFGILRAIINFVFKYFYESFQFTLIKLAFHASPETIVQTLNCDWKIPKKIKGDLQKPKPEKKPKEKPEKKEKPKPEKKEGDKKGKDDKKKDEKKKDEKKPDAKAKSAPLTDEEKAELERQRKEQERIEEELRQLEEHKRYMYPLTDATTDDFYQRIFDNWVKVDWKGGKGGKEKKK